MNFTEFQHRVDAVIALQETPAMFPARRELAEAARAAAATDTSLKARTDVIVAAEGMAARIKALRLAAEITDIDVDFRRFEGDRSIDNTTAIYFLSGPMESLNRATELYRLFDAQLTGVAHTVLASGLFLDSFLDKWINETHQHLTATP